MMHTAAGLVLPLLLALIPLYGLWRRVPVYETFVAGAREGFDVAVRILPYLVAMLCAIGMLRASGVLDGLLWLTRPVLEALGFPPELLPMALLRPLSGSGSLAVLADMTREHGADALLVKMAATLYGSTETTFYVLAVYFGAVGIRHSRYAVQVGLLADFTAAVAAVAVCRWLFA